jgi:hypothetical protein
MTIMERVVVCIRLRRRVTRATEMRTLLQHARPRGGDAAERVKQMRPRDGGGGGGDFAS